MVALGHAVHGAGLLLSHAYPGSARCDTDAGADIHAGSDGDTYAHCDAGPDAYSRANRYAGTNTNTDAHAGCGHTYAYAHTHAGSDGDTNTYGHCDADAYGYANPNPGCAHANGYADADAGRCSAHRRRRRWRRRIRASPADGYADPDAAPHGYAGAGPYTRTHANTGA